MTMQERIEIRKRRMAANFIRHQLRMMNRKPERAVLVVNNGLSSYRIGGVKIA